MIYKVSTTGTVPSVVLEDMGQRVLVHPTIELDLGLEYTDDELFDSNDLNNVIDSGQLTLVEKSGGAVDEEYVDESVTTFSGSVYEDINNINTTLSKLSTIQLRSTTDLALATVYRNVKFGVVDVASDKDTLDTDPGDAAKVLIKADGLYEINYSFPARPSGATRSVYSRVMKNIFEELPGSYAEQDLYQDETHQQNRVFRAKLLGGDFIILQARAASLPVNTLANHIILVTKLDGVQGDSGPEGPIGADGQDGVLTVSGAADYFNGYDEAGVTQLATSYTDILLAQGYITDSFSHSGAEVTIQTDDTYIILGRFTVAQPSTGSRSEAQMRLVVDTGTGYTEIPGTVGVCYSRTTAQGKSTATAHAVLDLQTGDKVKLQAKENSGGVLFGEQNGSGLTLFTTKGQTGPQGPPGTGSSLIIQDEAHDIPNTPHTSLNFTGSGVTVSDAGQGVARVNVSAGGTPIFGSHFLFAEDESETNTNSISPLRKLTLKVEDVKAGVYRMGWYYEWRRNTTSNDYRSMVTLDDTTQLSDHREESQDVNSWHMESGFYIGKLTDGNHGLTFSHYGESAGSTSYTRRVRLEIWRVE